MVLESNLDFFLMRKIMFLHNFPLKRWSYGYIWDLQIFKAVMKGGFWRHFPYCTIPLGSLCRLCQMSNEKNGRISSYES